MVKQGGKKHARKKKKEARLLDSRISFEASRCCGLISLLAPTNKALNHRVHVLCGVNWNHRTIVHLGEGKHGNDLHPLAVFSARYTYKKVLAAAAGVSGAISSTDAKAQWATWPWARITCHLHCRVLVGPKCEDLAAANEIFEKMHTPCI